MLVYLWWFFLWLWLYSMPLWGYQSDITDNTLYNSTFVMNYDVQKKQNEKTEWSFFRLKQTSLVFSGWSRPGRIFIHSSQGYNTSSDTLLGRCFSDLDHLQCGPQADAGLIHIHQIPLNLEYGSAKKTSNHFAIQRWCTVQTLTREHRCLQMRRSPQSRLQFSPPNSRIWTSPWEDSGRPKVCLDSQTSLTFSWPGAWCLSTAVVDSLLEVHFMSSSYCRRAGRVADFYQLFKDFSKRCEAGCYYHWKQRARGHRGVTMSGHRTCSAYTLI